MIDLSDREKAILVATAGVMVSVGMWMGVWLMPAEALSVPTTTQRGDPVAAFTPVPNILPLLSGTITALSLWGAYSILRTPDQDSETTDETQEAPADD